MQKNFSVSDHYFMTEFDHWMSDVRAKRSMEFSEQAKASGNFAARNFENVHEYFMWKSFNAFESSPVDIETD